MKANELMIGDWVSLSWTNVGHNLDIPFNLGEFLKRKLYEDNSAVE